MDNKKITDLVGEVLGAIPEGVKQMPNELETMLKTSMMSAFNKMELVTREEFDVQAKVLARTREKLEVLQQRLDDLEQ